MLISPTINHVHGRIRSITGTDPAADTEIIETVPARRRWKILSIRFLLTTDANVADRINNLTIDDGTIALLYLVPPSVHPASTSFRYNYANFDSPQAPLNDQYLIQLPPLILSPGYRIQTSTINMQAADNYTAPQLLVEEWIDP